MWAWQRGIAGLLFMKMSASSTERGVTGHWFQISDFERHLAADVRQGSEMLGRMTRMVIETDSESSE